ncbi:putative gustatory receptor 59b [Calliphora vicina]|uniref:putative gustatory receptor 59b n=1 Tax=Calliphora vicina TaxID=7373 RepID=UPI00325BE01C
MQWCKWIVVICNATVLNMIHIVMFGFFEMVWKICRLLYQLNYELNYIFERLDIPGINPQVLAHEIETISEAHAELCGILKQFLNLYQFQLITSRILTTTTNVISAYYGYVFIFYYRTGTLYLVLGGISYLVFAIDFYLTDLICDMISESCKQLIMIIQMFNEKQSLYRECEKFSYYLCSTKEILCHGGMDRAAWFKIMTQLVSSTIVLIQSHLTILNIFKKYNLEIY